MKDDVSHREILDRLVVVEDKIDTLKNDTSEVISAFQSAKGAFTVLNWIAGAVKPLLWIAGAGAVVVVAVKEFFNRNIGA